MRRIFVAMTIGLLISIATSATNAGSVPCSIYWSQSPQFIEGNPQDVVTFQLQIKCTSPYTVRYNLRTSSGSILAIDGMSGQQYIPNTNWLWITKTKPVGGSGSWQYGQSYTFRATLETYPNESYTSLKTLTIPAGGSGGGNPEDIRVFGHNFADPLTVNVAASGEIELQNYGNDSLDVEQVKIEFSGVSVSEGDVTEGTDFIIDADAQHWVGDPFSFTPLGIGTLRIDVRVKLVGGVYVTTDDFTLEVRAGDPCEGVSCPDTCAAGNIRKTSGTPTVSGTTCVCEYASIYDCDDADTGPFTEYYCKADGNKYSQLRYEDSWCDAGACTNNTRYESVDRLMEICLHGCSTTSPTTASCINPCDGISCLNTCAAGNVRKTSGTPTVSGASCVCVYGTSYDCDDADTTPVTKRYCSVNDLREREDYTDSWCDAGACTSAGKTQNDRLVQTCPHLCTTSSPTTASCTNPCDGTTCADTCASETRKYDGVATPNGAVCECVYGSSYDCNDDNLDDPAITYCMEDVGQVRSHQRHWDYLCVRGGCTLDRTSWINDTFVRSCDFGCSQSESLGWCNPSPCEGVSCPDTCAAGNIRKTSGTPTVSGTTCVCEYASSYDCDDADAGPFAEYYCKADGNKYSQLRYEDSWCDAGVCTNNTRYESVDRLMEICLHGCSTTSPTTASCSACTPNWVCDDWSACDGPDTQTRTCIDTHACGINTARPDETMECPCELIEVVWETTRIDPGEEVYFRVDAQGTCDENTRFTYLIYEDDLWPNPDDDIDEGSSNFAGGSPARIAWITQSTKPYILPDEYGIRVTSAGQEVEAETILIVNGIDPCANTTCPNVCDVNQPDTLRVGSVVYGETNGFCSCNYETQDCNELDTYGDITTVCGDDGDIYTQQRFADYVCENRACVLDEERWTNPILHEECPFGCEQANNTTANCRVNPCDSLICPYGCSDGACLPCVPDWQCTVWLPEDCSTSARSRVCWDNHNCVDGTGRPEEIEQCPCRIDTVEWSTTEARDGDIVELNVTGKGGCAGECAEYNIVELDWPPDIEWNNDPVKRGQMCFDSSSASAIPWTALFWDHPGLFLSIDPIDGSWDYEPGNNEYGGRAQLRTLVRQTTEPLIVEPHREVLGDLKSVLTSQPPSSVDPTVAGCFYGESTYPDAPIPPECVAWFAEAGEVVNIEIEELVSDALVLIIGETAGEVLWTIACTPCAGGVVAGCALSASLVCPIAVGLSTAVCDWGCLELANRKIAFAAGKLWPKILKLRLTRELIVRLGISHWRILREATSESVAYELRINDATSETMDLWAYRNANDEIAYRALPDMIEHYPGGTNYYEFAMDVNERAGGRIVTIETANLSLGPESSRAIFAHLFENDELPLLWWEDMAQMTDGLETHELLTGLTFTEHITDINGNLKGRYGETVFTTGSPKSSIRVSLELARAHYGNDANQFILHRVIPHELSHAAQHNRMIIRGYFPITDANIHDLAADEFFTDFYRLYRAHGTRGVEFVEWTGKYAETTWSFVSPSDGLSNGQRAFNSFERAFLEGAEDQTMHGNALWLVYFKAMSDAFGSSALQTNIAELVNRELRSADPIYRQKFWVKLNRLSRELQDDALTFAAHVDDTIPHGEFDDLVCRKYHIYGNCLLGGRHPEMERHVIDPNQDIGRIDLDQDIDTPNENDPPIGSPNTMDSARDTDNAEVVSNPDETPHLQDSSKEIPPTETENSDSGCGCASSQSNTLPLCTCSLFAALLLLRRRLI